MGGGVLDGRWKCLMGGRFDEKKDLKGVDRKSALINGLV